MSHSAFCYPSDMGKQRVEKQQTKKQRRVILYGQSVILGTLAATLKRYSDLEIIPLRAPFLAVDELARLAPDAIFWDVTNICPEPAWELIKVCPELLLVGLDPASNNLLIVSTCHRLARSTADLIDIVRQRDIAHTHEKDDQPFQAVHAHRKG